MPALVSGTQALGEPRYPSLKGIMAARSKEIATLSLADLGLDAATVGGARRDDEGRRRAAAAGRGPRRGSIREPPDEAARQVVDVPRRAEAHLMAAGIWVVGEIAPDGALAEALHRGRDARPDARRRGRRGDGRGRRRRRRLRRPPRRSSPRYPAARARDDRPATADMPSAAIAAQRVAALVEPATPTSCCVGASPDGRDVAGVVSALTGLGRPRQRDGGRAGRRRPGRRAERLRRQAHHDERASPTAAGSSPSARTSYRRARRGAPGTVEARRPRPEPDAARPSRSSTASTRRPRPPRSRRPGSSSRAAAASAAPRASSSSRSSPRRSAARSARPGRPSTRAGSRTPSRSARPARSSSRSCISRWASAGRSSTRSGCRRPARSSRSTATRTRRSPSSPTSFVVGDLFEVGPALLAELRARAG